MSELKALCGISFPAHKCELSLTHNEHRSNYETIEEWEAHLGPDWISDDERARAIHLDNLWVLQWYPETPVGFCLLAASSLESLLREAQDR